jgi:D-xylose transport system substrate-binding protein
MKVNPKMKLSMLKTGLIVMVGALISSCASYQMTPGGEKLTIGLLMESTDGENWAREEEYFIGKADDFGVEVLIRSAGGEQQLQNRQARELLKEGVGVLVVLPVDPKAAGPIIARAHEADIPVLAYGNLIRNAELDLYVAPDREAAGYLQARALLERSTGGGSILLGGCENLSNARLVRMGQLRAIEERVERAGEDIPILHDSIISQPTRDFARMLVQKALNATSRQGERIGTIMACNDETAAGAIAALDEKGLAGVVAVGSLGADLTACQRIIKGAQEVIVYTPPRDMARIAVRAAVRLAAGMTPESIIQDLKYPERVIDNGFKEVPVLLLEPVVVSRGNMIETAVLDGLCPIEELYQ